MAQQDMARYKREILEFYKNGFYHEEIKHEVFPDEQIDFMYQSPEGFNEMQM